MQVKPPVAIGESVYVNRNPTGRKPEWVRGRVVQLYPKFAVVEFPGGYRESPYYEDIKPTKEGKRRAAS